MTHEIALTETLVETLEQFETKDAERIINKLKEIGAFPSHFLDRLKNHPGYKLRVGDFRVLVDWDKENEILYAIDVFERKKEYRERGKYRKVWGVVARRNMTGEHYSITEREPQLPASKIHDKQQQEKQI